MPASVKISQDILNQIEIYRNKNFVTYKKLGEDLGISEMTFLRMKKNKTASMTVLKKLKDNGIIS